MNVVYSQRPLSAREGKRALGGDQRHSLGAWSLFQIRYPQQKLLSAGPRPSVLITGLRSPVSCAPPGLPGGLGRATLVGGIPSTGSKFSLASIREADFELPHTLELIRIQSCIFFCCVICVYLVSPNRRELLLWQEL